MPRAQSPFVAPAAAAGDPAGRQRLMPLHPRVGGLDELVEIRLSLDPPSAVVTEAQPPDTSGALTSGDPASGSSQNGIVRAEGEHVGPELRPDRCKQFLKQPTMFRILCCCVGHSGHHRTSRPVNQPAFCSSRRASSAVRWL